MDVPPALASPPFSSDMPESSPEGAGSSAAGALTVLSGAGVATGFGASMAGTGAAGVATGAGAAGFEAALRGGDFFFTALGAAFGAAFFIFFFAGLAERADFALAFFFFGAAFLAFDALFFALFFFDLSFDFFFLDLAMDSEPRTDETNNGRNRAVPQSSLETTEPPSDACSIIADRGCSKTQM